MKGKIVVIVKEPGSEARAERIENKLSEFQRLVGGYVETVNITTDAVLMFDEEGIKKGKERNDFGIRGTWVLCCTDGDKFIGVTDKAVFKLFGVHAPQDLFGLVAPESDNVRGAGETDDME